MTTMLRPKLVHRAFKPEIKTEALPDGVIGQVAGIALVYDVIDTHESTFARGALDRTIRERVAAGKVKLFVDHGDSMTTGFYDSHLHIGTVRSLTDVQLPDGKWAVYMVADIFKTEEGIKAKQYLESVLATGGETGLSIGGRAAGVKSTLVRIDGVSIERITEFPLTEISITAEQAVPDAEVLSVRAEEGVAISDNLEVTPAELGEDHAVVTGITEEVLENEFPELKATRLTLSAAFDALLLALPAEEIRTRLAHAGWTAQLGDAHPEDSDAAGHTPDASDAPAEDSQIVYATMDERIHAVRQSYAEV